MKISDKKVVALTYTLTVDGQVADQTKRIINNYQINQNNENQ